MKKFIAMLLVAMMALSLVACGEKPAPTPDPTPSASTYKTGLGMVTSMSGTDAEDEDPAKTQADVTVCEATFDQDGKIVAISFDVVQAKATVDADGVVTVAEDVKTKLELGDDYNMKGLGMVTSMSGTDAEDEDPAKTQADVTVCEATFDQDGKIVAISFDVVQAKATVDADGVVTVAEDVKTKLELGDDYNMKKYANPAAVGEWYEQAAALEAYCIGKTAAEVAAMELGPNAHDHTDTPAVEELKSTCTISVTAFLNALTKAYDNATTEYTGYAKAGLGMVTNMSGTDAEDEDPAKTQADVTAVALALDADGKIVAISIDVVQAKATVDADGVVTVAEDVKTKRELGDDYNMKKYASPAAVGEWYEQANAFEAYCIGKTADEVAGMPLGENAHGYTDAPAAEELKSTCTISVTAFLNAIAKAAANAK